MAKSNGSESSPVETPAIPDKLYFKIGEVARITGVEPYVLRYWESEFTTIQPVKQRNQRRYRKRDVEAILEARDELRKRGRLKTHAVEGARHADKFKSVARIDERLTRLPPHRCRKAPRHRRSVVVASD